MSEKAVVAPRRGPRGRVRRQVLDAARELVESAGYSAFTVDALVALSRVSKTTIYRWWDNRAEVALDMMEDAYGLPADVDEKGTTRSRIERCLSAEMTYHGGPAGRVLRGILADAQHRPALAATVERRYLAPRRAVLQHLVQRGIDEKEFRCDANAELMASLLIAPFLQSLLTGWPPRTEDLPREVVEALFIGLRVTPC